MHNKCLLGPIKLSFFETESNLSDKIQYIMKNYESALQTGMNSKAFVKENQSVANFEFGYKKLFDLV